MPEGHVVLGKPPDGGYGWVITFSAFMTSVILDGISFSFGIFYSEFLQYFNDTKAKTAWIGSIYNGCYLLLGPFVSILCNRFGCRKVSMVGGVIACGACILASFCDSVNTLIITYGFLGGIGFGMMYLPALVMVGYYFEKKRALATGIAVCGTGVGAFVLTKLSEFLIYEYGWRGATLIIAGIALNGTVCGSLLIPLTAEVVLDGTDEKLNPCSQVDIHVHVHVEKDDVKSEIDTLAPPEPKPNRYRKKKDIEVSKNSTKLFSSLQNFIASSGDKETIDISFISSHKLNQPNPQIKTVDVSRPNMRKDTFFMGSTHMLERNKVPSSLYPRVVDQQNANMNRSILELVTDVEGVDKLVNQNSDDETFAHTAKAYIYKCFSGTKILKDNPAFFLYGVSCVTCMLGFYVPFTYLPRYIEGSLNLGEAAASNLLLVIATSNLISRVLVGWLGDRKFVDCLYVNMVCLLIGGMFTLFFDYYKSMLILIPACIAFGNSIAVFVALRSIITVQFLGIEQLSSGIGFVLMCQGISSLIGTPLAGVIADTTGSLSTVFCYAGISLIISALLCIPMKITLYRQRKAAEKTNFAKPQETD